MEVKLLGKLRRALRSHDRLSVKRLLVTICFKLQGVQALPFGSDANVKEECDANTQPQAQQCSPLMHPSALKLAGHARFRSKTTAATAAKQKRAPSKGKGRSNSSNSGSAQQSQQQQQQQQQQQPLSLSGHGFYPQHTHLSPLMAQHQPQYQQQLQQHHQQRGLAMASPHQHMVYSQQPSLGAGVAAHQAFQPAPVLAMQQHRLQHPNRAQQQQQQHQHHHQHTQ